MAYTTIKKPSDYFDTKLYTGNNSSNHSITVGLEPSFTWIKSVDGTYDHRLFDTVRGATKDLVCNNSDAQATSSTSLTAFTTDGFTLGNEGGVNSGGPFVSWNWLANGAGSANTDGSISSTVSANTTSGFSIVKYTGTGSVATVGHGLGVKPAMIIVKRLNTLEDWGIYHQSMGASKYINLNTTASEQSSTSRWNGTEPTTSVFTITGNAPVNGSGDTYIAYCFAEKQGYSKFGSYTGNGSSTDGTFVYTGFKPAFVMGKYTGGTGDWYLWDSKRLGYNPDNNKIKPNTSDAETTQDWIDMYSNGFKFFNNSGDFNYSGYNFIYMAFAEEPLVGDNPATAR